MKSLSVIGSCYAAACAVVIAVSFAGCSELAAENDGGSVDGQQANRRSVGGGEYHHGVYAAYPHLQQPGHYDVHHGHGFASAVHYHAAAPDHHYHHAPAHGWHGGYAPGHHYHHFDIAPVHYDQFRPPIVYQSVVNTYPTATATTTTTVVHKPVPVPVAQPVPVPVARPVPVEVPRPYPVPVNRPYPVTVVKPVPVPQPYPVYRPYPVVPAYRPYPVAPAYRPLPGPALVARPAVRVPVAVRVPYVRHSPYRVYAPSAAHSYRVAATVPRAPSHYHLRQLTAAVGAAQSAEYDDASETHQQQTPLQEDAAAGYPFLLRNEQHEDAGFRQEQDDGGYASLTADDETFTNSLGVPSTDYSGKKK